MKTFLLLMLFTAMIAGSAKATIHSVQVANFQFSPANISNVTVGDTMRWIWVSGFHTTTNDPETQTGNSMPAGATAWDATISTGNRTFDYKVTVPGVYNYWCTPHAPNMAGSFTASTPLPVKLSSFAISTYNGAAVINWKTLSEQNVDYFSVRRSLNGSTYNEIGMVKAVGNSVSEKSYSFADPDISNAAFYYYSLAIIDKDGKKEYSEAKIFRNRAKNDKMIISISPNPITKPGHLMIAFNAGKDGQMNVEIINANGQRIIRTQMQAYRGVNNGHIHLGVLPAGNYVMTCILNGIKETRQIVFK